MSSVQIINHTKTEIATYMTLACGKVNETVSHNPTYTDAVRVCVQNSSNRAYRMGVGKAFPSFDAAIAAYKSASIVTGKQIGRAHV